MPSWYSCIYQFVRDSLCQCGISWSFLLIYRYMFRSMWSSRKNHWSISIAFFKAQSFQWIFFWGAREQHRFWRRVLKKWTCSTFPLFPRYLHSGLLFFWGGGWGDDFIMIQVSLQPQAWNQKIQRIEPKRLETTPPNFMKATCVQAWSTRCITFTGTISIYTGWNISGVERPGENVPGGCGPLIPTFRACNFFSVQVLSTRSGPISYLFWKFYVLAPPLKIGPHVLAAVGAQVDST